MRYVIFSEDEITGLKERGLASVLLEISNDGSVLREVGLDSEGKVAYVYPGSKRYGKSGLFDNAIVEVLTGHGSLNSDKFNEKYNIGLNADNSGDV